MTRRIWPWVALGVGLAALPFLVWLALAMYAGGTHGFADEDPAGFRACQAVDSYLHHTLSEELAVQFAGPEADAAKTAGIRDAGTDLRALHAACVDAGYEGLPPTYPEQ
jgi:hypothetical protein